MAEALYSLQRGAMLGRVVGHADECAQLFHLFLKADLPLARAMLVPRAYQVCQLVTARLLMHRDSILRLHLLPCSKNCMTAFPLTLDALHDTSSHTIHNAPGTTSQALHVVLCCVHNYQVFAC